MIKRWAITAYLLAFLSLLWRFYAVRHPDLVEYWYSERFYTFIRIILHQLGGCLPFPSLYVIVPLLLWGFWYVIKLKPGYAVSGIQRTFFLVFNLGAYLSGLVFLFLLLWGYNYCRIPVEDRLNLKLEQITEQALRAEFIRVSEKLSEIRADSALLIPENLHELVAQEVSDWLLAHGYPADLLGRGRLLLPAGTLLRFGTAGFYFPYSGEGHIDAGLHPLQMPAVLAHELAHGHGFGDEGVCNFIAFASGAQSVNPYIAYSAYLSYWQTLAVQYRRINPDKYLAIRSRLHKQVDQDLQAIRRQMALYPDIWPRLRDVAYDRYLKTQGIAEGMQSYHKVIMLVMAYHKRNE